ncbi:flagellar type III secretion system pore protein FliP [Anaerotignum faecicola]|nr:flagellar type III secretion system pore protein FliP [Anaerotignum faecicola]
MGESIVNINGSNIQTLELFFIMTVMMLLPSIVVMMTSFTRIVIVLSFTRNALGTQQTPPNTVLVGIALFLTLFIMSPTLEAVNRDAYIPYKNEEITQEEALKRASVPMKEFMLGETEISSLNMYLDFAGEEMPEDVNELPLKIVIPAFMTSELKQAFIMGFLIFIPFLLIDIVVSSALMSMGMIMLPPATISLPFKLLLFVTVDGWELLFSTLVKGFGG